MRIFPLLMLAVAPVLSMGAHAQVPDTDFHAFAPPSQHSALAGPASDGMTVYRPPGAAGSPATVAAAAPGATVANAPASSTSQEDPYTASLREPMRMPGMPGMPGGAEPQLPPPLTAKGLPLPPIPVASGMAAPAYRPPVAAPEAEQINAYAPPTAANVAPAGDLPADRSGRGMDGIPAKARELIEDKYSGSPPLQEAAIAFVRTNLAEWNQVKRSHKFSRVATRLSVEAQICLAAKIDHYAPDLAEGFTKEFKNALTSTSDLRQLYYDALQAAEYQEVVVDKDTDEACKDVGVTPENVDAP
jgi:hypothetical protein